MNFLTTLTVAPLRVLGKIRGPFERSLWGCRGVHRDIQGLGFPKMRSTLLGIPIIRIIEFGVCIGFPLSRESTILVIVVTSVTIIIIVVRTTRTGTLCLMFTVPY